MWHVIYERIQALGPCKVPLGANGSSGGALRRCRRRVCRGCGAYTLVPCRSPVNSHRECVVSIARLEYAVCIGGWHIPVAPK
jgi:hypothetical protein